MRSDQTRGQLLEELEALRRQLTEAEGRDRRATHLALDRIERFRLLFETMVQGVIFQDAEGKIISANPAAERILGLSTAKMQGRTSDDPRWRPIHEDGAVFPGEAHPAMMALRTGEEMKGVVMGVYNPQRGERVWIRIHAVPLFRPGEKNPYQVYTIFDDISEQKQAGEKLRASKRRYQGLFDSALDAILLADDEGCYVDANPAACQLLGYEREVLLDLCVWDITPSPDLAEAQERWQSFLKARKQEGEITLVCREGQRIKAEYRAVANVLPGLHLSVMRDVTERKRTEEALKRSERELRMMADNVPVLFSYLDAKGCYRFVNKQYEAWFDLTPEEIVGRHYSDILGKDTSAKLEEWIEAALAGQRVRYEEELPYTHGGSRWVVAEYVPDVDEEGQVQGLFAVVTDISEQREARKALLQSLKETAHAEDLLLSVSHVAQEVQRARTLQEVHLAIGRAVQELGFEAMILHVNKDGTEATLAHLTFDPALLQAAVELTGIPLEDYGFSLEPQGILRRAIDGQGPLYVPRAIGAVAEMLPQEVRSVAPDLEALFDVGQQAITPLRIQGQARALIIVMGHHLDETHLPAIAAFANQAAIALENAELYQAERAARQELRNLAGYLEASREEERTRIARQIHDELGQVLTALKMDVAWLARRLPTDDSRLADKTETMSSLIDATVHQVRRIATDLRPGVLDDLGLAAAIEWQMEDFAGRTGLAYDLAPGRRDLALDPELATSLFRIFQEALTNVARHAEASQVWVALAAGPDHVVLTVRDDGRGITPQEVAAAGSLGLTGMQERARLWGGEVEFAGEPGRGTTVTVRIPRPTKKERNR